MITLCITGALKPFELTVMAVANEPVTLGCELYGYAEESTDIVWQFSDAQLQSDSVYTISVETGNHSLQNGGDAPESSTLSLLTIQQPNSSHTGTYICAGSGMIRTISLDVEGTVYHVYIMYTYLASSTCLCMKESRRSCTELTSLCMDTSCNFTSFVPRLTPAFLYYRSGLADL